MLLPLDDRHRALVHRLRDQAESWLRDKGIDQYSVGPRAKLAHANIDEMFDRGEFVGWFPDGPDEPPAAVVALTHPDPDFWTPDEISEPQGYISRFLVDQHGHGYGEALLEAVAEHQARAGNKYLRLDCWKTNTRLHAYYLAHGFHHVRTVDVPGRMSGALFERPLACTTGPRVTGKSPVTSAS